MLATPLSTPLEQQSHLSPPKVGNEEAEQGSQLQVWEKLAIPPNTLHLLLRLCVAIFPSYQPFGFWASSCKLALSLLACCLQPAVEMALLLQDP